VGVIVGVGVGVPVGPGVGVIVGVGVTVGVGVGPVGAEVGVGVGVNGVLEARTAVTVVGPVTVFRFVCGANVFATVPPATDQYANVYSLPLVVTEIAGVEFKGVKNDCVILLEVITPSGFV
jgi:hypothetical protein